MYVARRRREHEAAQAAVARHEPYVQACAASLQAAALEAETLRRLETRRRQAYLAEAARVAMAELDEFAVMRAARGSAS
jgi:flagellar biosynthesis chaperone FliJ